MLHPSTTDTTFINKKKNKDMNESSYYLLISALMMTAKHTNVMLTDYASDDVQQLNEQIRLLKDESQKTKGNFYIAVSFPLMALNKWGLNTYPLELG